jgi:hypothetical protein
MKYQLTTPENKNAMRLQSIGLVLGTPAENIKQGDFLMWNFGSVYVVNEIIKETAKMIIISTSPKGSNDIYQQKLNKSRLVCKLS